MMASGALGCTATAPLHDSRHSRHMAALIQLPAINGMSSASKNARPPSWPHTCRCRVPAQHVP